MSHFPQSVSQSGPIGAWEEGRKELLIAPEVHPISYLVSQTHASLMCESDQS